AAEADEGRRRQRVIHCLILRGVRVEARGGPLGVSLVLTVQPYESVAREDGEVVLQRQSGREGRRRLTAPGLAARAHDGIAVSDEWARVGGAGCRRQRPGGRAPGCGAGGIRAW